MIAVVDTGIRYGNPDPEGGFVDVFELDGGNWAYHSEVDGGNWSRIEQVALHRDLLVLTNGVVCESACSTPSRDFYRLVGGAFVRVVGSVSADRRTTIGFDGNRMVVARTGFPTDYDLHDNLLRVTDVRTQPQQVLFEERIPITWDIDTYEGENLQRFTDADLSGDVVAYESCCASDNHLYIRRFDGSSYLLEATIPVIEQSAGVSVLSNEVVLVADASERAWIVFAHHDGAWERATKLPLPDGATFQARPVAVGDRVAVSGGGAVHVLTVETRFHDTGS